MFKKHDVEGVFVFYGAQLHMSIFMHSSPVCICVCVVTEGPAPPRQSSSAPQVFGL